MNNKILDSLLDINKKWCHFFYIKRLDDCLIITWINSKFNIDFSKWLTEYWIVLDIKDVINEN